MSTALEGDAGHAPLGIIAGLGHLPVKIAEAAHARNQKVFVVRLKGFVEPALDSYPGTEIGIAEIGKILKALKHAECEDVCFAGRVARPDFAALKPDLKGLSLLPKVVAAARQGDDALLRVLVETVEADGFRGIGAEQASGALLAGAGVILGAAPSAECMADIHKAAEVAAEIGRLDIGQGAIVCDGLVLCVEAQEGTDLMLQRCAQLDPKLRGDASHRKGVLVKRPKPIQDRRIDLPTIGPMTIEGAAAAGLAGVAVETGGALLVSIDDMKELADRYGLFVYGFPKDLKE